MPSPGLDKTSQTESISWSKKCTRITMQICSPAFHEVKHS